MPYLDNEGLSTLWSKIKNNFAHSYSLNVSSAGGAEIKLMSGDGATLTNLAIPPATSDQAGIMTADQAGQVAKIKNLATVATSGKYSDLSDTPNLATVATTGSYSDLSDKPTSLKNPNALTIGDVTYDGSAAKSITAGDNVTISGGKISATDTTYSAATTSAAGLMSSTDKVKLDGIAEGAKDNIYIAQYGSDTIATIRQQQQLGKLVFVEWYNMGYIFPICYQESDEITFGGYTFGYQCIALTVTLSGWSKTTTKLDNFAKLANPTFTGTPAAPTAAAGTNTTQIATTAFVKTAIDTSGATTKEYVDTAIATAVTGVASYDGTVANADELKGKTYKKGNYYVVSLPTGTTWTGYENGDMFFAKVDKSGDTGSLDDFDVVQANITAMTADDIKNICTLS